MQPCSPRPTSGAIEQCLVELRNCLGANALLTHQADLLAYDGDAYPMARSVPRAVALPPTTEHVAAAVRICARHRVAFVPRGAGTGLSGGATADPTSIVISTARMAQIKKTDIANRRLTVEAGCTNQSLTDAVAKHGLHYAPDPSSQGVCTIGGNIAENAGGPHTLKHGVTVNHVTAVRLVLPDGVVADLGGPGEQPAGYDLVGLVVGSEGTFGVVTEATVKLTPTPAAVRTLLAVFDRVEDCTRCVVEIISCGLVPCAMEMIDRTILGAIEAAFHFGFPDEAAAVLTIELDGSQEGLDDEAEAARDICMRCAAREVRLASADDDRARLWIARKKGVGTTGRLASSIVTQDGAIPRSQLPTVLARVSELAGEHGIRVCNIFHAGDGNLHPCVLFDQSNADEAARVHAFNEDVLRLCVSVGGTISGEHGVGLEKRDAMRLMFSETDLDLMRRIRSAFDPAGICNPGKLVPGSAHDTAEPIRQVGLAVAPPIAAAEPLADPQNEEDVRALVATARASRTRLLPTGSGLLRHLAGSYADGAVPVRSTRMCGLGPVSPADTLITCGAGTPFAELQSALTEARQWVPLDPPSPETATVGGIVASNVTGLLRCSYGAPGDWAVRLRAVTGDGRVVTTGARVVKNAAGYDVGRLLAGSDGSLAFITEITFKTRPRPPEAAELAFRGPTADAANRFAWEVSQQHPQLEAVAVLGGPDPRVLVMLAGNRAAVERQAQSVGHLAAASGLDPTSSSGLADAARARLWALETDAAVRVSSGPFDAYGQAQLFSQAGFHYCWQVGCGLTVVDAGAGGADRLAHHLQTILPPQATYRWLRAPAGARVHDRRYASAEAAAIARRLKSAMDPDGVFPQTPHDSVAPRYATEAGGHA